MVTPRDGKLSGRETYLSVPLESEQVETMASV